MHIAKTALIDTYLFLKNIMIYKIHVCLKHLWEIEIQNCSKGGPVLFLGGIIRKERKYIDEN